MAAVGSAVGLGNIFRFPALTASYGIWFIVFYIIALFTVGLPLLYAELSFGREKSKGAGGLPVAEIPCVINCFLVLCCYLVFFALVSSAATAVTFSSAIVNPPFLFGNRVALTSFPDEGYAFGSNGNTCSFPADPDRFSCSSSCCNCAVYTQNKPV